MMTDAVQKNPKPGLWGGLFAVNMALIAVLAGTGALEHPTPAILIGLNMILLIPMVRAASKAQEQKGAVSKAMRSYNQRFLGFSLAYMVVMLVSGTIAGELADGSPGMWVLAILPMFPVFGMIWTMFRYLQEETDEYLRLRAVNASLVGLGLVLVLGTGWGFLETFGLVPHVWAWWVFPTWAIGLGIGMIAQPIGGGDAS
ncbi:hypothetical protein [Aurantiacibacter sp. MUD61]|uniref:hypothetical protein n=1 Tax=Aurantiacibacter sp. MUD61 TaxID=3009083 RepID=UPI0022F11ACA|nr:hypothetical protein [Aurantiacibacter sp. MUD61]